jgi:hypothetical protein
LFIVHEFKTYVLLPYLTYVWENYTILWNNYYVWLLHFFVMPVVF